MIRHLCAPKNSFVRLGGCMLPVGNRKEDGPFVYFLTGLRDKLSASSKQPKEFLK